MLPLSISFCSIHFALILGISCWHGFRRSWKHSGILGHGIGNGNRALVHRCSCPIYLARLYNRNRNRIYSRFYLEM